MYEEKTFDSILDGMRNRVSEMLPELDTREGSVIYNALAPAALEMQEVYMELDRVLNESFADTQSREFLIRRCAERGIYPDEAACAVRKGEFTGEYDDNYLIGAEFSLGTLRYKVIEKLSEEERNGIRYDIFMMECATPGKAGNLDIGDLTPLRYIDGLYTARLTEILTAGRDEELTEHLRQRYFDNANAFAFGGNIADYKTKVLSLSRSDAGQGNKDVREAGGVGYVKVIPASDGPGTVKIIILDAEFKTLPAGNNLITALQKAIDPKGSEGEGVGIAPIGHTVTVVSAKEEFIEVSAPITYVDGANAINRNKVKNALISYFTMRVKEWKEDEPLTITIGEVYMCLEAVDCVKSIEVEKMKLNGKTSVAINLDSIPVWGGLNDGPGN